MNLDMLYKTDWILFETISGSNLYGTNVEGSDVDLRGIFKVPMEMRVGLLDPISEISNEKDDIKYFELKKYMKLASEANPNILELLYKIDGCVKKTSPAHELLHNNRHLFITKKCKHSYNGYAYSQIKRCTGQNKKVNNYDEYVDDTGIDTLKDLLNKGAISDEWIKHRFCTELLKYLVKNGAEVKSHNNQIEEMDQYLQITNVRFMKKPTREDFVYIVDTLYPKSALMWPNGFPFRPRKATKEELEGYDCSAVEHLPFLSRIYREGTGVFKDGQVLYTSIPKEREWDDFTGVLYYNENDYERTKKEYESFWEWMANRNDKRYVSMDKKEIDYDAKNVHHCARLLLEAENIATEGDLLVRFTGDKLKFLMDIRQAKYSFGDIMNILTEKMLKIEEAFDKCSLPNSCNMKKVDELYKEIVSL